MGVVDLCNSIVYKKKFHKYCRFPGGWELTPHIQTTCPSVVMTHDATPCLRIFSYTQVFICFWFSPPFYFYSLLHTHTNMQTHLCFYPYHDFVGTSVSFCNLTLTLSPKLKFHLSIFFHLRSHREKLVKETQMSISLVMFSSKILHLREHKNPPVSFSPSQWDNPRKPQKECIIIS